MKLLSQTAPIPFRWYRRALCCDRGTVVYGPQVDSDLKESEIHFLLSAEGFSHRRTRFVPGSVPEVDPWKWWRVAGVINWVSAAVLC